MSSGWNDLVRQWAGRWRRLEFCRKWINYRTLTNLELMNKREEAWTKQIYWITFLYYCHGMKQQRPLAPTLYIHISQKHKIPWKSRSNICTVQCKQMARIPNCISTWNVLPDKIKKAENIRIFKKEMEKQFNCGTYKSKTNPLDHTHNVFFGKILTQIKLKLSPLKSQLFNYNLIDNPFCPAWRL